MDYFPDRIELFQGLDQWIKNQGRRLSKTEVHERFLRKCHEFNINGVAYPQFTKLMDGKTKDLKYTHLRALIAALEIDNWPKFLDLCHVPTLADVVPIGPAECEKRLVHSITDTEDIEVWCVKPERLRGIRTRIDVVKMIAGQATEFRRHYGHEYVHLLFGHMECQFGDGTRKKQFELRGSEEEGRKSNECFAVAFPAGLEHSFKCLTDVQMVVGRSAKSRPKGLE